MALTIKRKEFNPSPAGLHHARIIRIIDLGTQTENFQGKIKQAPKIMILFEYTNKAKEDGTPEVIPQEYTASIAEKSNLYKAFSTLAPELTKAEEFDLTNFLGKPCAITVIHKTSGSGKTRAKVESVSPPMDGAILKEAVSTPKYFDLSAPDWELFAEFGDWISEKIRKSPEYAALTLPENAPLPLTADEVMRQPKVPLTQQLISLLEASLKSGAITLPVVLESYELTEAQRLHFENIAA